MVSWTLQKKLWHKFENFDWHIFGKNNVACAFAATCLCTGTLSKDNASGLGIQNEMINLDISCNVDSHFMG
jgi:hypothetical protein